ncbi:MAG: GlsB/YeaQ/YmgE family stress response membrane protein [Pseudomonadota bacterium]
MNPGVEQSILWWLLVGLAAGWLTGGIIGGRGYGPVVDLVLGLAGALAGGLLAKAADIGGSLVVSLLFAAMGAIIAVAAGRAFKEALGR